MQTERYSHGHHESVLRAHTWRTAENSVGYLLPHLRPGASLLDVGAGPGTITVDLACRLAPGRVVGVDASADVVAQAQAHAAAEGVTNVTFQTADAAAIYGALHERKVITDYRGDRLRIGFGVYQDDTDVDRLADTIAAIPVAE